MKRPIAMLLALLLTAGLFAFVSCGEAPYKDSAFWTDEFGISAQKIQKQLKKARICSYQIRGDTEFQIESWIFLHRRHRDRRICFPKSS